MTKGRADSVTRQEQAIAVLLGQQMAIELLANALIASHPDPIGALAAWEELKAHSIDRLMESGALYRNQHFRDSLHTQLASFETGLRVAADASDRSFG